MFIRDFKGDTSYKLGNQDVGPECLTQNSFTISYCLPSDNFLPHSFCSGAIWNPVCLFVF